MLKTQLKKLITMGFFEAAVKKSKSFPLFSGKTILHWVDFGGKLMGNHLKNNNYFL